MIVLPEAANSARSPVVLVPAEPDRDAGADGVGHLRGERALPDQLVQPELVRGQLVGDRAGGAEDVAGRPDRLVRLLGVLDLADVTARLRRHVLVAVELAGLLAGRGERGLGQVGRVGPHVGDVAVLVQPLRGAHRALDREPQLAAGLLLQRAGHERRVRPAPVGLLLDPGDLEGRALQAGDQAAGARLVEVQHVAAGGAGVRVEVAAGGDAAVVDARPAWR